MLPRRNFLTTLLAAIPALFRKSPKTDDEIYFLGTKGTLFAWSPKAMSEMREARTIALATMPAVKAPPHFMGEWFPASHRPPENLVSYLQFEPKDGFNHESVRVFVTIKYKYLVNGLPFRVVQPAYARWNDDGTGWLWFRYDMRCPIIDGEVTHWAAFPTPAV